MKEIARIGRQANPAERGLQLVIEHPEVLDRVSKNLLGAIRRLVGCSLERAWDELSESERGALRTRAIELIREHVNEYAPPSSAHPPPDPPTLVGPEESVISLEQTA